MPTTIRLPLDLTPRARKILEGAAREARARGHGFIGVEHIFLAVLSEGESLPAHVLGNMRLKDDVWRELDASMRSPAYS